MMGKKIGMALLFLLLLTSVFAAVDEATVITFEIISSTAMSVAYQGTCSASEFACRSSTGTQTEINITTTTGTACQTNGNYAMRITNDGTTALDIKMSTNASLPTGITLKTKNGSYAYSSAIEINETIRTVHDEMGTSTSTDWWFWCDYDSYNGGEAIIETREISTNATAD